MSSLANHFSTNKPLVIANRPISITGSNSSTKSPLVTTEELMGDPQYARNLVMMYARELKEAFRSMQEALTRVQATQQTAGLVSSSAGAMSGLYTAAGRALPQFGSAAVNAGGCALQGKGALKMNKFTTKGDEFKELNAAQTDVKTQQQTVQNLNNGMARGQLQPNAPVGVRGGIFPDDAERPELAEEAPVPAVPLPVENQDQSLRAAEAALKEAESRLKKAERIYNEGKDKIKQELQQGEMGVHFGSKLIDSTAIGAGFFEASEKLAQARTQVMNADARQSAESRAEMNKAVADALAAVARLFDVHM